MRSFNCAVTQLVDGLLEVRLHTDGGPFLWSSAAAAEVCTLFGDIARDPAVRVVILTGTGNMFCGQGMQLEPLPVLGTRDWEEIRWHGEQLLDNLLAIQAPIIACVNGPAIMHAEIPLISDIVLAAEETELQDAGHFLVNVVPGDGLHVIMPLLMGLTRARYFLLTAQKLTALEAKEMGLVNEILPRDQLLPRARELAATLLSRNPLVLRYTRLLMIHHLKGLMHTLIGFGAALEGLALIDQGNQQCK